MEINKQNRSELKQYFKINDKPTQEEFADFIDAGINQVEDGIVKLQGNPLAIQAEGDQLGTLGVLDVYRNFADENPQWSINLNPRTNAEEPSSNQPGLNIKDATGQSRLFIKSEDGNAGVGTIEPTSKLTVVGKNTSSLISAIDTTNAHATVFEVTQQSGKGMLTLRNNANNAITQLSGAIETPNFFLGKVGIGTSTPIANVQVSSENAQIRITNTNETNGTSANLSIENAGSTERWEMGVQKGQEHLSFGTANEAKKIAMKKGGILAVSTLKASNAVEATRIVTGNLKAEEYVSFGHAKVNHILQNGVLYRAGSAASLAVKNFFFIRDINDNISSLKFYFDTKDGRLGIGGSTKPAAPLSIGGSGKENDPNEFMHITNRCILFGGENKNKFSDSAQISAGRHQANSLNIVGMGTTSANRKIDFWAEGGMNVRGQIKIQQRDVVAFSVALSANMTGAKSKLVFGQINYNIGDHFKNNQFVAPVKGMYLFTMSMRPNTSSGDVGWLLRLNNTEYVNGSGTSESEAKERTFLVAKHHLHMNSRTVITMLNENDTVHVEQFGSGGNDNYSSGFEGILLQAIM